MREFCHVEYEKECETKTRKFTKITGYEDVDCKEIEVCKIGNIIEIKLNLIKIFQRTTTTPIIITRGKPRLRPMDIFTNVRRR